MATQNLKYARLHLFSRANRWDLSECVYPYGDDTHRYFEAVVILHKQEQGSIIGAAIRNNVGDACYEAADIVLSQLIKKKLIKIASSDEEDSDEGPSDSKKRKKKKKLHEESEKPLTISERISLDTFRKAFAKDNPQLSYGLLRKWKALCPTSKLALVIPATSSKGMSTEPLGGTGIIDQIIINQLGLHDAQALFDSSSSSEGQTLRPVAEGSVAPDNTSGESTDVEVMDILGSSQASASTPPSTDEPTTTQKASGENIRRIEFLTEYLSVYTTPKIIIRPVPTAKLPYFEMSPELRLNPGITYYSLLYKVCMHSSWTAPVYATRLGIQGFTCMVQIPQLLHLNYTDVGRHPTSAFAAKQMSAARLLHRIGLFDYTSKI